MSAYTVRLELVGNPSEDTYQRLHKAMAIQGYARTVPGIDSAGKTVTVNLPTGLYYGSSAESPKVVASVVHKVATAFHSVKAVFVAQTTTWSSLP